MRSRVSMRFPRFKQQPPLEDATPPPKISHPVLHHSSISFEESTKIRRPSRSAHGDSNAGSDSVSASLDSSQASSSLAPLDLPVLEMNNDFETILEIVDNDYTQVPELSESPGDNARKSTTARISAIEPPEMFTEDTKEWSPNTLHPETTIQAKFIPATPMRESSRRFSVRGEAELADLTPPQEEWQAERQERWESVKEGKTSPVPSISDSVSSPAKPEVPPKDQKLKRKGTKTQKDTPESSGSGFSSAPQSNSSQTTVAYGAIAAPARSTSMRSSGSTLKAAFGTSSTTSPKEMVKSPSVNTLPRASSRRFSRELQLKQHLGETEKETGIPPPIKVEKSSTIEEYKLAISRLNEIRLLQIRQRDERIAQLEALVLRQQQSNLAKFEALTEESDSSDSSSQSGAGAAGTRGRIQNMRILFPIA